MHLSLSKRCTKQEAQLWSCEVRRCRRSVLKSSNFAILNVIQETLPKIPNAAIIWRFTRASVQEEAMRNEFGRVCWLIMWIRIMFDSFEEWSKRSPDMANHSHTEKCTTRETNVASTYRICTQNIFFFSKFINCAKFKAKRARASGLANGEFASRRVEFEVSWPDDSSLRDPTLLSLFSNYHSLVSLLNLTAHASALPFVLSCLFNEY